MSDYLSSPALIDISSLLFSWYRKRETFDTVRRWSDFLITRFHQKEAIQLLEVALSTGACKAELSERLRSVYYSTAQGYTSKGKEKPPPSTRLRYRRILQLGYRYGYIYKFIAQAFYELGKLPEARRTLEEAYRFDPQLSGAVRLSRLLRVDPTSAIPAVVVGDRNEWATDCEKDEMKGKRMIEKFNDNGYLRHSFAGIAIERREIPGAHPPLDPT